METSQDLPSVAAAAFREFRVLYQEAFNTVIGVVGEQKGITRQWIALADAVPSDNASYSFSDTEYHVIFLWPIMAIQVYPGRVVNTYWWRANDVTDTRVFRGWLSEGGERDPATLEIAEIDRDTTFAEDLPLLRSVQRGLSSRGYKPGPLVLDPNGGVDNELSIYTLHRRVREALGV